MKRIVSMLCILALMATLFAGIPAAADTIGGLGENWSYLNAGDTAVYTKDATGFTISESNWWTGAVCAVKAGADCTVDMTFVNNNSLSAWWGIYARLNGTGMLEDMTPTVGNTGVRGMVTLGDASIHAADGTITKLADDGYTPYDPASAHTMRLVCDGADIRLYLDDMETPVLAATTTKLDGDYIGFYAPNSNGCAIQSISVNGTVALGDTPSEVHNLTATAGNNGWILPSAMEVETGERAVFQLIPQKGYEIDTVTVNGQPAELTAPRSFTIDSVSSDAEIHATFRPVDPMNTDRWFSMLETDPSVLTMTDEGGFAISESNWEAARVFALPMGPDGTVEMTFSNNGVNTAWWSLFARLDSTDYVNDLVPATQNPPYGIRADIVPEWAEIFAPYGEIWSTQYKIEDGYVPFDPNEIHTIRLVCQGENIDLYLDDMDTPVLSVLTTKLDGDYAGIYFPNSNGCVINSVKINGEIVMGYEDWNHPTDDTSVYTQPTDTDVVMEMGFVPTSEDQEFGLFARADATDSVTGWEGISGGEQGVGVSYRSDGLYVGDQKWDLPEQAGSLNQMHILRLTLSANSLTASIDGVDVISTTTERLAGNFVGYLAPEQALYVKVDNQIVLGDEVFVMSAKAGTGGSVKPEYATVSRGESHTYTIEPDEGYVVDKALLDGQEVSLNGLRYTVIDVDAGHEFEVTFRQVQTFTVTATAGEGGSVSPATAEVTEGESHTITITPDEGYTIDTVTLDGETVEVSNGTLTISDVRSDHEVSVTFRLEAVYGDVDGNGDIDAADALKVLQHTVQLISLDENQRVAADVNKDGEITAVDALCILQYTVRLIDKLPVTE